MTRLMARRPSHATVGLSAQGPHGHRRSFSTEESFGSLITSPLGHRWSNLGQPAQ